MENNDCFSKMMAASKQAAKKVAKEKATKVSCPNCDSTFPNKGALVQQCKYKHRAKSDVKKNQPKINFDPQQTQSSSSSSGAKRKKTAPPGSPKRSVQSPRTSPKKKKPARKPKTPSPRKARARVRFSNETRVKNVETGDLIGE